MGHRIWIKKFFIVNIINLQNVDKPRGGGPTMWIRFFVEFRHFLIFFLIFFCHFNTYLVVFSLYLAIIKEEKIKEINK